MKLKKTIILLSNQVNEAFHCTKGLYEMKTKRRIAVIFFRADNCTDVIKIFSEDLCL